MVLGLDASSTTVGYSYVSKDREIIEMGFIDIKKIETLKDKAFTVLEKLEEKEWFSGIERIVVEDSLQGFMYGGTNQKTIIKLAKFNAILCFILEWSSQIDVILVNPSTSRKKVFGRARVKGKKAKEYVREQIEERFDVSKWMKMNQRGNFDQRNIDSMDALVCALYGLEEG